MVKKLSSESSKDDGKPFCVYCECFHRPNQKLLCSFNRAVNKIAGIDYEC